MPDIHFRAGVGMIVVDARSLVLVGQRSRIEGSWQAPQGGLATGENPLDAAYRELFEEIGLTSSDVVLVDEYPDWLAYELPAKARSMKTGRGQVLKWFLFRFVGSEDVERRARSSDEFLDFQWWPMSRLVETVWPVKTRVYEQLAEAWAIHFSSPD